MTFKRRGGRKETSCRRAWKENHRRSDRSECDPRRHCAGRSGGRNSSSVGRVKNLAEIARVNKVDGSYVSRILDLTLLAPDIIDAFSQVRSRRVFRSPYSRRSGFRWCGKSSASLGFGQSAVIHSFPF
jgi:hypothetical protein